MYYAGRTKCKEEDLGAQPHEFKLEGCVAACHEGGIISVASDRDPTDRLVWSQADAEAAARVFRHLSPVLAACLRELASAARMRKYRDKDPEVQE